MKPYVENIEDQTKSNTDFRHAVFTGQYSQLVLMSLLPGEEIGVEVHPEVDQFFRIDEGSGEAIIEGQKYDLSDGMAVVVPAGAEHNIVNTGDSPLKLYTIYSPANHPEGTVHKNKAEAEAYEKEHHH